MRKRTKFEKITVAAGMALALAATVAVSPGRALASPGYDTFQGLYTSQNAGGTLTPQIVQTSAGDFLIYSGSVSLFGNTIPSYTTMQSFLSANAASLQTEIPNGLGGYSTGPIGATVPANVSISSITTSNSNGVYAGSAPFYNISGISPSKNGCPAAGCTLNLQFVNQINTPFTANISAGNSISGDLMSNVFKVGSGSNLSGANPGELVFTYQFEITSATSSNGNLGITGASVSFFNDPNGYTYTLGTGTTDTTSINTNTGGSTYLGNTSLSAAYISGLIQYDNVNNNGSIELLTDSDTNTTSPIGVGFISPEVFVASNTYNYTTGTFAFEGSGAGFQEPVFVPDTPEPGTLVLFGTALGLVSFMVVRRRRSQIVA